MAPALEIRQYQSRKKNQENNTEQAANDPCRAYRKPKKFIGGSCDVVDGAAFAVCQSWCPIKHISRDGTAQYGAESFINRAVGCITGDMYIYNDCQII